MPSFNSINQLVMTLITHISHDSDHTHTLVIVVRHAARWGMGGGGEDGDEIHNPTGGGLPGLP